MNKKILLVIVGVILVGFLLGLCFLKWDKETLERAGEKIAEKLAENYVNVYVTFQPDVSCASDFAFNLIEKNGGKIIGVNKEKNSVRTFILKEKEQNFIEEANKSETVKSTEMWGEYGYPTPEMIFKNEVKVRIGFGRMYLAIQI